ncbi:MAG: MBL fold metallo-hydrolase [Dehalococcoidia bacterium]|nr:MBL fold metallo-hydrolase [Dehalococcoidia bacterium]
MEIYTITPNLRLLNLQPPIPGYGKFIGAYLFCGEKNAIIDVGPKTAIPNLLQALTELNLSPDEIDYILLTHIHIDHAGGVGTAAREMSQAKVLAHSRAVPHLVDPTVLWQNSLKTLGELALKYGEIEPVPEHRIIAATDQMRLNLGHGLTLEIYLTPGHATHHLSIFDRSSGVLIAGEAAGVCAEDAIRPTTPPPFKLEETLSSIDKLINLEPQKLCYGHFGCYDNGVERLKSYRQKLLDWHKTVGAAAKAGKTPEDILTLLREKDNSLSYLDRLGRDEYSREFVLLINSIKGLAGSVQKG